MKDVFQKYAQLPIIRYIFVGGCAFVLELIVLFGLYSLVGLSQTVATGIAFWFGLTSSFLLQKVVAFKDYRKEKQAITHQIGYYILLVLFNYVFTLLVVSLAPARYLFISRTIALLITTAWNFVLYKKVIFAKRQPRATSPSPLSWLLAALRRRWLLIVLLTIPILLFHWQYLASGNKLIGGDFDYVAQMYEAFRISVVKFHQFPSWNPWMAGGLPLFANPQFGLFSLQSLLVLPFGAIYGLKLAYVIYAMAGFWGMWLLSRKQLGASLIRSSLVAYIWILCGFFINHNISHFTFALFYLLPWFVLLLSYWRRRFAWLAFGGLFSVVLLSSVHYAFLMMSLSLVLYVGFWAVTGQAWRQLLAEKAKAVALFTVKTSLVVLLAGGYRFLTTYIFVKQNQRPPGLLGETAPTIGLLLQALFVPIQTSFDLPKTQWSWGEYSAYLGVGTGLALVVVVTSALLLIIRSKKDSLRLLRKAVSQPAVIGGVLLLAVAGFLLALGDFSKFSPFNILHELPGFAETRVSSRWLIFTAFGVLLVLAAWRRQQRIINLLLLGAVIELVISFGPSSQFQSGKVTLPPARFNQTFSQYDNGREHLNLEQVNANSYYFATTQNKGQIYADDSIINTLNGILPTTKCGENVNPACDLVTSDNAEVIFWSPNRIKLRRTNEGNITLNMNREKGWRVNNRYLFADRLNLDPSLPFVVPGSAETYYTIQYAPALSPNWLQWRLNR